MPLWILYRDGELKHQTYKQIGIKGLSWQKINEVHSVRGYTSEEKSFLDRHGLAPTQFNVACLRRYGFIHIPTGMLKYLKNVKLDKVA